MLYSGVPLDRAPTLRRADDWEALINHPEARFYPVWRGLQLVGGEPPTARWLAGEAGRSFLRQDAAEPAVFLGLGPHPVFVFDISGHPADADGPAMPEGGNWVMLRAIGGKLPRDDAALLAYARGLMEWQSRTRFCPACGGRLQPRQGGHVRVCSRPDCGIEQFPRTDAAVIMMVVDGDGRALLGRQPSWTPGMYSCLAGFVEPGETLEETVAREVFEEAGIRVHDIHYAATQPWPFPASLMVGFTARSDGGIPVPDPKELEDVRWFTRAEVRRWGDIATPGPDGLFLPRRDAIARTLVDDWLRG